MKIDDSSFLGTGWSFPPTFRREWYGLEMLKEEADVRSSIEIILNTLNGERVMQPTFGCDLQPFVFEPMNPSTIAMIKKIVTEALIYHEPRIIVEDVRETADIRNGILQLEIFYSIITTNTRYNYVFPFYMREATNIET
ncbi:MAG TPA: GPW/gp25 family protein [Chitinophagaceae bacterium]